MFRIGDMKYAAVGVCFAVSALAGATEVRPGDDLQAVLDKGKDEINCL